MTTPAFCAVRFFGRATGAARVSCLQVGASASFSNSFLRVKHYNIQPGAKNGRSIHNALIIVKRLRRGVAIMSK